MGNEQPTQGQIKELWEWRGFRYIIQEEVVKNVIMPYGHWIDPEGNSIPDGVMLLPIDLNNLFEYAMSKFRERYGYGATVRLLLRWVLKFMKEGLDPALALFWAIWEIIHKETSK